MICCAWSIVLVAIDRFLYIVHGMKYKLWMYPRRARLMIVAVWIFSFFIGVIPVMSWSKLIDGQHVLCWFITLLPLGFEFLINAVISFPIVFIVIIYSFILAKALKKVK